MTDHPGEESLFQSFNDLSDEDHDDIIENDNYQASIKPVKVMFSKTQKAYLEAYY